MGTATMPLDTQGHTVKATFLVTGITQGSSVDHSFTKEQVTAFNSSVTFYFPQFSPTLTHYKVSIKVETADNALLWYSGETEFDWGTPLQLNNKVYISVVER